MPSTSNGNQDDTSALEGGLSGIGDGINIAPGTIAAIVILLVLAIAGLIVAGAYACGGFKRCCACCTSRKNKRLSQLPTYSNRGYLDERDRLPAWNPNASTTEMQGLSRMQSVKLGIFSGASRQDTMGRRLMDDSPVNSPRGSRIASPALHSPYLTDSGASSQKSRFSLWRDQKG